MELGAEVASPLIGVVATAITAIFGIVGISRRHVKYIAEIEHQARLDQQRDLAKAGIEYRYKAKIKLYERYYPLRFLIGELSHEAYRRLRRMAEASRNGVLPYWLSDSDPFVLSSIYRLFAPLGAIELMRGVLSDVDLTLDKPLRSGTTPANQSQLLIKGTRSNYSTRRATRNRGFRKPIRCQPGNVNRSRNNCRCGPLYVYPLRSRTATFISNFP